MRLSGHIPVINPSSVERLACGIARGFTRRPEFQPAKSGVLMKPKDQWPQLPALHATRPLDADAVHESAMARHLVQTFGPSGLTELYGRFVAGPGAFDGLMRRIIWRALAGRFGNAVIIEPGAMFRHPERIEIGNGVFIGAQSFLQGRFDGTCRIGDRVWIGPQTHLDARDLVIGEAAGISAGVRIIGVEHTGEPAGLSLIATPQRVGPVRIGAGALISTGAIIGAGVTIGAGAWIGAGALVLEDIPDRAVAVGVPAKVIRIRARAGADDEP